MTRATLVATSVPSALRWRPRVSVRAIAVGPRLTIAMPASRTLHIAIGRTRVTQRRNNSGANAAVINGSASDTMLPIVR